MSRWPAMIWAMCGGSPVMIASVMKIRRKSCGVQCSGLPAASVSPAAANASSSMSRTEPTVILPVLGAALALEQHRRGRAARCSWES